ncbi:hypothetical protein AAT19DRAFT_12694 [Rhodotorula toruloides]|uniref:Uncharacterized protein n=1 Tax=Rhodotorula toruloides TaxID=5286 RepID=A0A2T0AGZ8_RHOTO|nr:hypothetical protein AAT19DRAFT_12694 [Rhodotorula toruloides]
MLARHPSSSLVRLLVVLRLRHSNHLARLLSSRSLRAPSRRSASLGRRRTTRTSPFEAYARLRALATTPSFLPPCRCSRHQRFARLLLLLYCLQNVKTTSTSF